LAWVWNVFLLPHCQLDNKQYGNNHRGPIALAKKMAMKKIS